MIAPDMKTAVAALAELLRIGIAARTPTAAAALAGVLKRGLT
jgi:hypothetical protein